MFFISIFGIQQKDRIIKEFDNTICPDCGRLTRAELGESYTFFHFFFIPLFKWNKKYFVKLRCCGSIYMVESDYVNELINSTDIDFDKLSKVQYSGNLCPNCGTFINPNFIYCPYCGQKRSKY